MPAKLTTLLANLASLGTRRLVLLGIAFALILGAVVAGSVMLSAPTHQTIYSNLERGDAARIARELSGASISHRLESGGTAIAVPIGRMDEARMLLAERGLPESEGGGYELFDNIGSLGLTSFMQEVTRVRALEGEIARTIRSIGGVSSARVHLVLGDEGSFRQERREPSASIVVSARSEAAREAAPAIRHLVASAVPGLAVAAVTVLDDRGRLLASGEDMEASGLASSLRLVRTLETEVEDKVARALTPFLGHDSVRVSAKARIDTTREETSETVFDPDSRVEREVRVERETRSSNSRSADEPVTVEQDLPDTGDLDAANGEATSESDERRAETTAYEINSRTVNRVRDSFRVDRLTVAVVVDRSELNALTEGSDDPAALTEAIAEVRRMAISASGLDEERGDVLEVTAVDFTQGKGEAEAVAPGALDGVMRHTGTLVASLAFVVGLVALALVLRPVMIRLAAPPERPALSDDSDGWGALPDAENLARIGGEHAAGHAPSGNYDELQPLSNPAERLARLVELDEERTAQVLRRWINEEAA